MFLDKQQVLIENSFPVDLFQLAIIIYLELSLPLQKL